jgi:hypothetical protein
MSRTPAHLRAQAHPPGIPPRVSDRRSPRCLRSRAATRRPRARRSRPRAPRLARGRRRRR